MSSTLLNDKIALITGSTQGIGWQTAQLFAQEGATVVINGHQDEAIIKTRVQELQDRYKVPAFGLLADFSKSNQIEECYQKLFQQFKRVDIVVNNAGIMLTGLLGMISDEMIARSLDLNVIGVIQSMQCAARLMKRQGKGSIINIASVVGLQGAAGQVVYSATKGAVIAMTKSAAKELAPSNIRVNCVAPGLIQTKLFDQLSEKDKGEALTEVQLGRIGQPEEVARVILLLASDQSAYMTGQVLGVDGGMF